ncbi:MAG: SBBP repeat-containing protein [Chloroflexota bacterium]
MPYKWLGMMALALMTTCFSVRAQTGATVYSSDAVDWKLTAPNSYTTGAQSPVLFLNVSADEDGQIYVANLWSVLIYDAETGRLEDAIVDNSGTVQQYDDAEAVGDGTVWVADSKTHNAYLLDQEGNVLVTIPPVTPDNANTEISPSELELGPDGNLYALYSTQNTVMQVFTPEGEFVRSFTMGDSSLSSGVIDFAFAPDGNLYIAGVGTIRILDTEGNIVVENFAEDFLAADDIAIRGIAVDADGNVYFGGNSNASVFATDDPLVAAVYKFDAEGNFLAQFGKGQQRTDWGLEFQAEELGFAVSLAILPEGQVIVSDANGAYSQLFRVDMTG